MPIMDAAKSVLSGVATPFEHPVQTADAVGKAASNLGNDLVSNAGRPAPSYSVDPTTGQMQTQQGPATKGNFFKSILTGALLGLAAGAGADNPAAAFGAGAGGVIRNNQQQDQLARQQATQDFQSQLTAQQNQRDVTRFNTEQQVSRMTRALTGIQTAIAQQRLKDMGVAADEREQDRADQNYKTALDQGFFQKSLLTDLDPSVQQLEAEYPDLHQTIASGQYLAIPYSRDGKRIGTRFMIPGPNYAPDEALTTKDTPVYVTDSKTGKLVSSVMKAGTITNWQARHYMQSNQELLANDRKYRLGKENADANMLRAQKADNHENASPDKVGKLRALQAEGLAKVQQLMQDPMLYSKDVGWSPEGAAKRDLLNAEYGKKAEAIAPGGWAVLHAAEGGASPAPQTGAAASAPPAAAPAAGGTVKKFSVSAWKKANPTGNEAAAEVLARQQGYQILP